MINDDRCRRVMKKFRKRRRQKNGLTSTSTSTLTRLGRIGVEGFEMLEKPKVRRRTTISCLATDGKDDGEEFVDEDYLTSSTSHHYQSFSRNFKQQNSQKHRYHNHENKKYSRRNHIDWGESLVRRRAFAGINGRGSCGDSTISVSSEPELVHRKPESIHTFSYYSSCTFLDFYNKVLAVDNQGTLDLIRLGDIRSETETGVKRRKKMPVSHQKLATNFELGAELQHQSFSTVHVQALSGGHTIAFGLEDDSLCLLDLEGRTNRCVYGDQNDDETLTPVLFSTGAYSTSSLSSLFTASRTKHPRRTHYRDRRNPRLSLHELCCHHMNQLNIDYQKNTDGLKSTNYTNVHENNDDISELHAIDYTTARERIASPVRFIPGLSPPHDARWDILEVHPNCSRTTSLLYVAHVDSDYDAFWTQVLDGRVRAAATATTTKGDRNRYNATTVLIDGTTRDHPGEIEEHVTACAMVTDICMATAHISCGNFGSTPASEFFDRGLPYAGYSGMSSSVKLWDLRMVKKRKTNKAKDPIPADTIIFPVPPSFQHADFAVLEPSVTIQTRLTSRDGALAFSEAKFADRSCVDSNFGAGKGSSVVGSDHVITNLSAARDPYYGSNNNGSARGGSLIVTTQSRTKSTRVEHAKLDLSGTMRMARKISQTNSNLGCQPVYAIASSHEYLATCSNMKNSNATGNSDDNFCSGLSEASTRLCLYNLNEAPHRTKSAPSEGRYYSTSSRLCQQQREDPTWSFQTDSSLTDRYGVKTELSCIALNSNGTALLGGTTDGDLFVWRGI
jgi:hypothetical protein